jgi:hypothetical protein
MFKKCKNKPELLPHKQVELFIKRLKEAEKISDDEMTFELTLILRFCKVLLAPYCYTDTGIPMRFCPPPPRGATLEEIRERLNLAMH